MAEKNDDLPSAERRVRIVPAFADVSDSSLARLRRQRVKSVFEEQARRTYLDHWYGGRRNACYYQTQQSSILPRITAKPPGATRPRIPFKSYLESEPLFPVAAKDASRFVITDEPKPELVINFKRQSPRDIDGLPVFWASPVLKTESRVPVSLDTKNPIPSLIRTMPRFTTPLPKFPIREGEPIQISGFFRECRTFDTSVPVDIYRLPDRIAATAPGLTTTAIAIRADSESRKKCGYGTGAVAVVLDCSGSLGPVDRKNPKDKGLYADALRALDELMHKLPPGTILNVWVFGEKMADAKSPEDTIREILPPTELPHDA